MIVYACRIRRHSSQAQGHGGLWRAGQGKQELSRELPKDANVFIEQQLDDMIGHLEKTFDADAIGFSGNLYFGVDDVLRPSVETLAGQARHPGRLVIILTTSGGFIEVVQRIVAMLRHYYDHVAFVIPNYAFSAGTVLAMSGDEIHMDYYSRLGPIDPQVETADGKMVPALGYLIQWARLLKKASDGKLTLVEAQLMIDGFDQAELYKYEQARELSVTLLTDWLARYKFKNWKKTETRKIPVTSAMRKLRAKAIARQLNNTEKWHSHGHGISMEVLRRDMNLRIDDLDDSPETCCQVKNYYGLLSDFMGKNRHGGVIHCRGSYVPYQI